MGVSRVAKGRIQGLIRAGIGAKGEFKCQRVPGVPWSARGYHDLSKYHGSAGKWKEAPRNAKECQGMPCSAN
ncbi:hypothetical protein E2C01_068792 [Portunus trituberculatus]|uniref:Uncharacterized protein n=1 Tax=Portunus trituberculatus TaxID=210409 RepID=A0A5B7I126_PORTR|nr:hypothetical protein [Portunus trituberculatus]